MPAPFARAGGSSLPGSSVPSLGLEGPDVASGGEANPARSWAAVKPNRRVLDRAGLSAAAAAAVVLAGVKPGASAVTCASDAWRLGSAVGTAPGAGVVSGGRPGSCGGTGAGSRSGSGRGRGGAGRGSGSSGGNSSGSGRTSVRGSGRGACTSGRSGSPGTSPVTVSAVPAINGAAGAAKVLMVAVAGSVSEATVAAAVSPALTTAGGGGTGSERRDDAAGSRRSPASGTRFEAVAVPAPHASQASAARRAVRTDRTARRQIVRGTVPIRSTPSPMGTRVRPAVPFVEPFSRSPSVPSKIGEQKI